MVEQEILRVIWFVILMVAWVVYLSLESFVVGSSMLQLFVTKDLLARQKIIDASGLHWDGIEVWLITALGGTFAAFPLVFAKLTESLYIAFFLLLLALTVRGVTIELAFKDDNPKWQQLMTAALSIGSFLIPMIFGVYFANVFLGIRLGVVGYEGTSFGLLGLSPLVMGVLFVSIALTTGSCWIVFNTGGKYKDVAFDITKKSSVVSLLGTLFIMMSFNTGAGLFNKSLLYTKYPVFWAIPVLTVFVSLGTFIFVYRKSIRLAFVSGCLNMAILIITGYSAIFPYMVPSSIDQAFGITISDAASSATTLNIITIAVAIFVPIVIAYQSWKFWYFNVSSTKSNKPL